MKEIIEAFASRIKSPVFGYLVLFWTVFNWRPLFYLFFSDTAIDDRLSHFDKLTDHYSLAILPLCVAAIMAVTYPWINLVFLYLCKKPIDLRNFLQAESEHKLLIRKKELEEVRSALLATKERILIDRAKRDEEILSIADKETKEKLQQEITKYRTEIDTNKPNNIGVFSTNSKSDLAHSFKQMADILQKQGDLKQAEEYMHKAISMEQEL